MSDKPRFYCDAAAFLRDHAPDLLEAFERMGLGGRLRPQAHAQGLTLLLPAEGSAARKLLAKFAKRGSAEPAEFVEIQRLGRACLLRRVAPSPKDFVDEVINDLDRVLRVQSADAKAAVLAGAKQTMRIAPHPAFLDCAPHRLRFAGAAAAGGADGRPALAVYEIREGEPVVDAPEASREQRAALAPRRRARRAKDGRGASEGVLGGGPAGDDDAAAAAAAAAADALLRKEVLAFAAEQTKKARAVHVRGGGYTAKAAYPLGAALSAFAALSISLADFLRRSHPEAFEKVQPLICFEDGDFFALVQPCWTARAGRPHVPAALLNAWWESLGRAACAAAALANAPLKAAHAELLAAHQARAAADPRPEEILKKIDEARMEFAEKVGAADTVAEIQKYYQSPYGPMGFLPEALRADYAAAPGALLREHELRFAVHKIMWDLQGGAVAAFACERLCVFAERAFAGAHLIVNIAAATCQVAGHAEALAAFINSTHFGATPFLGVEYPFFDAPGEADVVHIENCHGPAQEARERGLDAHERQRQITAPGGGPPAEAAKLSAEELAAAYTVADLERAIMYAKMRKGFE